MTPRGDSGIAQLLQRRRDARVIECEPLPHLDRRGVVAQSNDNDGHAELVLRIVAW